MEKVTLSYAESRYRWGQFTITEPSRFFDEIDEKLIDKPRRAGLHPSHDLRSMEKSKAGFKPREPKREGTTGANQTSVSFEPSDTSALQAGMQVEHPKFGNGKVLAVEGQGPNKKATVFFNGIGQKSLLLRFAKLRIIS